MLEIVVDPLISRLGKRSCRGKESQKNEDIRFEMRHYSKFMKMEERKTWCGGINYELQITNYEWGLMSMGELN
jgi:hypothetical protein